MNQQTARETWPDPVKAEIEYARLASLLYAMTDAKLRTKEATKIREAMDLPWYAMDDAGQERSVKLCLDVLYPKSPAKLPPLCMHEGPTR